MKKIRLATVGAGYFSQFHYKAWQRIPEVNLISICNRDIEAAEKFAQKYSVKHVYDDFEEMLDKQSPDLVDIITPPETHLHYIKAAIKKKVAIICQKPFCMSIEEAELVSEMAKEANVLLVIHENFRFQPWYKAIKEQLLINRLGDLYQSQFCLRTGDGKGPDAYLERQPYFQKMDKFLVHETGIHWIDTFRYLFGEIQSVYAQLRQLNPSIAGEDSGLIIFVFDSGLQVVFDGNRLVDHVAENRRLTMGELIIEGSEAVVKLNGDGVILFREFNSNVWQEHHYEWANKDFGGDCVYRFQEHVIRHLLGLGDVYNSSEEYLKNLYIEKAVYLSAKTGRSILIDELQT